MRGLTQAVAIKCMRRARNWQWTTAARKKGMRASLFAMAHCTCPGVSCTRRYGPPFCPLWPVCGGRSTQRQNLPSMWRIKFWYKQERGEGGGHKKCAKKGAKKNWGLWWHNGSSSSLENFEGDVFFIIITFFLNSSFIFINKRFWDSLTLRILLLFIFVRIFPVCYTIYALLEGKHTHTHTLLIHCTTIHAFLCAEYSYT